MVWIKFSVLLIVSVIKCNAMSYSEIEEFSNFLRRTSQLDHNLKKNIFYHIFQNYIGGTLKAHPTGVIGTADEDEDDPVSDYAWEESGKFEGDLILNERQRRLIVEDVAVGLARNGLRDSTKKWPDNEIIYYIQPEHFSTEQTQAIKDGMEELTRVSCITFKPYKKGDKDAVVIQGNRRGCFSQVGYQGGYQVLNLSGRHPVGRGCFRPGTVVHELLHTLGFYHMQSSPDRDDYVNVLWDNIVEQAKNNFRKYNAMAVTDYGVGYDYESVLHYSRRAFSSNGLETLVPKQKGAEIGQRLALSEKDILKLNKMYCNSDPNNFDADGFSTKRRPVPKKKHPKNKPFEGHGLGYQQGKTVLITLPAANNVQFADQPSYQVLDYFSRLPQIVPPPIEGLKVQDLENIPLLIDQNKKVILGSVLESEPDLNIGPNPISRPLKGLDFVNNLGTDRVLKDDDHIVLNNKQTRFPSLYSVRNNLKNWKNLKISPPSIVEYNPLNLYLDKNEANILNNNKALISQFSPHLLQPRDENVKTHTQRDYSTRNDESNNEGITKQRQRKPTIPTENLYDTTQGDSYSPRKTKSREESPNGKVTIFPKFHPDAELINGKINVRSQSLSRVTEMNKNSKGTKDSPTHESGISLPARKPPVDLRYHRTRPEQVHNVDDDEYYDSFKNNDRVPSFSEGFEKFGNYDITPYYDGDDIKNRYSGKHVDSYSSLISPNLDHSYEQYSYPFNTKYSSYTS